MKNKQLRVENTSGKKCRFLYSKFQRSSEPPAIIMFLIRKHIVKSEAAARWLVVLLVCLFFLLSMCIAIKASSSPSFIG